MRGTKRTVALLLAAAILCAPTALAEEDILITDAEEDTPSVETVAEQPAPETAAETTSGEISGEVEIFADELSPEEEESDAPFLPLVTASAAFAGKPDPSELTGRISTQSTSKKDDVIPYKSNNKKTFPMYTDIKLNFTMLHYYGAPESRAVIRVYHSSGTEITEKVVKSFKKNSFSNQKLAYTLKVGKSLEDTEAGILPIGTYTVQCYAEYKSGGKWKKAKVHTCSFYIVPKMQSAAAAQGGLKIRWMHAFALYTNGENKNEQYLDVPEQYVVYRRAGTGKWRELTRGAIAVDKPCTGVDANKLKNGTQYSYSIRAICNNKLGQRSKPVSYYYLTASVPKASRLSPNSVKLSWKRNAKASGYQIRYADNTSMDKATTRNIKGSKTTAITLKKLKKNVKYFAVRSCKTVKGKTYYSAWSGIEVP